MDAWIRFQTRYRCRWTGRPAGIFVVAGRLEDSPHLAASTRWLLRDELDWFSDNLVVPDLGDDDWRSLFWLRADSREIIRRMWSLSAILRNEGIFVRKIWTTEPGKVIYSDKHQIAAIPLGKNRPAALRF